MHSRLRVQLWRALGVLSVALVAVVTAAAAVAGAAPARAAAGAAVDRAYQPYEDRAAAGRWAVSFGAGLFTSGDLFRVVWPGTAARWWTPPGGGQPFFSRDFTVAVDQDVLATMSVSYHLSRRWLTRFDLGWSDVPATARVRIGDLADTSELIRYDRLTFVMVGVGVEARLLSTRAYPFLTAGPALVRLSATGASALDQTRLALRGGAGFHWSFDPSWGARAEVHDTLRQFDMSGYGEDPALAGAQFTQRGPQNLFEFSLSVRGIF